MTLVTPLLLPAHPRGLWPLYRNIYHLVKVSCCVCCAQPSDFVFFLQPWADAMPCPDLWTSRVCHALGLSYTVCLAAHRLRIPGALPSVPPEPQWSMCLVCVPVIPWHCCKWGCVSVWLSCFAGVSASVVVASLTILTWTSSYFGVLQSWFFLFSHSFCIRWFSSPKRTHPHI